MMVGVHDARTDARATGDERQRRIEGGPPGRLNTQPPLTFAGECRVGGARGASISAAAPHAASIRLG
jgi:hypothetical protein